MLKKVKNVNPNLICLFPKEGFEKVCALCHDTKCPGHPAWTLSKIEDYWKSPVYDSGSYSRN